MTLPAYILRQIAGSYQRGGSLTTTMKPLAIEVPQLQPIAHHSGKVESDEFGGLEYQWWQAIPTKLSVSTSYKFSSFLCRACGTQVWTKFSRDKHFQYCTCRAVTTQLLKELKKEGRCLQCKVPTNSSRYGALLCGKQCEEAWLNSGVRSVYWLEGILRSKAPRTVDKDGWAPPKGPIAAAMEVKE